MKKVNRRDFLKLMGISPLLFVDWPLRDPNLRWADGQKPPNILIVVFDALSALNMSLFGYPRRTTPNLERIAETATVFHRHYAGGNFTTPGTASLLAGVYPWSHRALHFGGTVDKSYLDQNIFHQFGEQFQTFTCSHNSLVNILFHQFQYDIDDWARVSELCVESYNYADQYFPDDFITAYQSMLLLFPDLTGLPSSFFLSRFNWVFQYLAETNLNEEYKNVFPRGIPNFGSVFFTIEDAVEWTKSQVSAQPEPFLGYVHWMPPHYPYATREEFINIFDDDWQPEVKPTHPLTQGLSEMFLLDQRRLYDEFIAYVDAEFGRLFDSLEQIGALEDTIVLFTSDHGEMFERGIWAHTTPTLFEPVLRIPLLIWRPGQDRRKDVFTPTSCVDILPTLLHMTGQPIPAWCEGQVLPRFADRTVDEEPSIYAVDAQENPRYAPLEKASVALVRGPYKLVHYMGYAGYEDEYELYDLETDPEELVDLYPSNRSIAAVMKDELLEKLWEVNQPYIQGEAD